MSPIPPSPLRLKTKEEDLTWLQRLKRMEKKDLAALAVCLLLLGALPVIEQILSSGGGEGKLGEGFAVPGTTVGPGGEVYEPGIGVGAPGGLPGQPGGEIITPLAGRDPTSLVMGLGGPPKPKEQPGLRDALADAMRRSVPEVAKQAPTPTQMARLSTTLASLLGGGGAGGSAAAAAGLKPSAEILAAAKKEPGRAADRTASYAGAIPPPGYAGVGQKRGQAQVTGEGEKLKAAADAAASKFTRTSAIEGLGEAAKASELIKGEAPGGGGPGVSQDAEAKKAGPGASTAKSDRSFGASLDQQKEMARFQDWLERCKEKRKAYKTSFSGGMWALFSGNLFSGDEIDCDKIPNWVFGPLGSFMDKFVGEGFFGSILDPVSKGYGEKIGEMLGPGEKEFILFVDWQGNPVQTGTDKVKCGLCPSTIPKAVGKCAFELVARGKGDQKETVKGDAIGDHCRKVGGADEEEKAKAKETDKQAATGTDKLLQEYKKEQSSVSQQSQKSTESGQQSQQSLTPEQEKRRRATVEETDRSYKVMTVLRDKLVPKLLADSREADRLRDETERVLLKHCEEGRGAGHPGANLPLEKDAQKRLQMVRACFRDHVHISSTHNGPEPAAFIDADDKAYRAREAYDEAWKAYTSCSEAIARITNNKQDIIKIGDREVQIATEAEIEELKKKCQVPKAPAL